MFELIESTSQNAIIKVIGVGGGGGNAISHMQKAKVDGVEFIAANTDAQALKSTNASLLIQIGNGVTKGLGAGADPEVGRQSAIEDKDKIKEALEGADMVFITAGMGGGTGTGAAPVVAEVARELGCLTVAIVTRPFPFEGRKRILAAEEGINKLSEFVDSLIVIPNEKLLTNLGKGVTLLDAFKVANDVLLSSVQGISQLITKPGLINVDFADVKAVMANMGSAMMGTGESSGENRAKEAAEMAIRSPLLEDVVLHGAKGVLVNITSSADLSIAEFEEVGESVRSFTSEDATVIVGTVIDEDMGDNLRVTLVATGLGKPSEMLTRLKTQVPKSKEVLSSAAMLRNKLINNVDRGAIKTHNSDSDSFSKVEFVISDKAESSSDNKNNVQSGSNSGDMDYLEIPAFLRKKESGS